VGNQSHAVSRAISLGLFDVGEVMVGIDGLDRLSDAADPPGADQSGQSGESGESGWGLEPAPRPRPGLGRVEYERGRPALAVLCGPAGPAIDQVMLTLIRAGLPFVRIHGAVPVAQEHWARWHRGPLTAVLVDPAMEDWTLPDRLDIPAVVVQSTPPDGRLAVAALQRGAYALVWLADVVEDLCPVLSLVAHGYRALSAAYVGELSDWMSSMLTGASASPEAPELTARERDILFSIARGHTVRQTAHALGISAKTVENTQARLFRKLGTRNRSETLTAAYRLGLVDAAPMP
jgi:DNA-binding NarL/FixJ family response regulator